MILPAKPCTYPGCKKFGSGGRCEEHKRKERNKYDNVRDKQENRQFLHSQAWRAIRLKKLQSNPLCERCYKKGIVKSATIVHHRDRNELNCDETNLESLCFKCHEEEHYDERLGRQGNIGKSRS